MKQSKKADKGKDVAANPHDRFFKEAFTRKKVAGDFFRYYLPENVLEQVELASLQYVKDSFVDKFLKEYYSDLLFKVDLKNGDPAYLYILLEHKSFEEKTTAFQLLRYIIKIWEMAAKKKADIRFPVIIPVVLYHGEHSWGAGTHLNDMVTYPDSFTRFLPDFEFVLWDASRYDDDEIKGHIMLQVTLLVFRYIFRKDLRERLPDILGLLQELVRKRTGREYLETLIRYVLAAAPKDHLDDEDVKNAVIKAIPKIGGEIMVTIADTLIERGMLRMAQEDVVDILEVRFSNVPQTLRQAIASLADIVMVKTLLRKAIQTDSLEEFEHLLDDVPK